MKKIFFVLIILCFASPAAAQTTPESYLKIIPAPPKNACNPKAADKSSYQTNIHELLDKMDKDIRQRKKDSQAYADANRDKIAANMMSQAGQEAIVVPKKGKMSKEERKALAEQMMQQQYGVSPEDTKKLKKMTKEEKTAWAQGYGADAAAKAQADPQRYQNAQKQAASIYNLQIEQKDILARIDARKADLTGRIMILDQNAAAAKARDIDPLQRESSSLMGLVISKIQEARIDQASNRLKAAKKSYCETYSPQYLAIVDEYLTYVKTSLPDYRRLEEIIAKTQLGLDRPIEANKGLLEIQAVRDYAGLLRNVFKYNLLTEEQ
ncbi:MAG: hypothetical protein CVU54_07365 [Deltaproteobacteria bacterium HGW-Deltaproteobacteria-12]|jgi:hypothetical protein|nr:MAG: hypothetical protein CVU54_07365 [Deltaproteobacteria bacterium HGW-Deltaproteobacteria-12]